MMNCFGTKIDSYRPVVRLYILLAIGCTVLLVKQQLCAAEFAPHDAPSIAELLLVTRPVREMEEAELLKLVPEQSGLHYVGCPNCKGGRQENQLTWSHERPDEVSCQFCNHRYPSEQYPMNQSVVVQTPSGRSASFPYWADANGYRYFFRSKRDTEARAYIADQARNLALLYQATKDPQHARRALLILDRFAQLFPDWCYHYDYPFQQKEIYDGVVTPENFRRGFRTARWSWWAYNDIPFPLVQAYDWIANSHALAEFSRERGRDARERIERDLIRAACEQVLGNEEAYSNMSPRAWHALVVAGRVLREPRYVHEVVRRVERFAATQFFYDGIWSEGSPDYAWQSVEGVRSVLGVLQGYSDPPGYLDVVDGTRFDDLDLKSAFPVLERAHESLRLWHLPDGRPVPVHDTWSTSRRGGSNQTEPYLLPALGHACLGGGSSGDQTQFHLTWSGGYGHSHGDNLSLLLFAQEKELLSDLGYTHTAYRSWTLATAAHNTVVIDGCNQSLGNLRSPTDGSLIDIDLNNSQIQYIHADGKRGYPNLAEVFERQLVVVDAGAGQRFALDVFQVQGGRTHDYFIHGYADGLSTVETSLAMVDRDNLLPSRAQWEPTKNEGEAGRIAQPFYAYGFLRRLRTAKLIAGNAIPVSFLLAKEASSQPAGVRVIVLPESDSELILGENPSIRQAGENDAELDKHHRPFLIARHHAQRGRSQFVSLIEPFSGEPVVRNLSRVPDPGGGLILRVELKDRIEWFVFGAEKEVVLPLTQNAPAATFQGKFGCLIQRESLIENVYALGNSRWILGSTEIKGTREHAVLRRIENGSLVVDRDSHVPPDKGSVILLQTADSWSYPFTIRDVIEEGATLKLVVVEGASLKYDASARQLQLASFPARTHSGQVSLEWSTSADSRP